MITNEGKLQIKRLLAGYVPTIAQTVVFGIGTDAEAATDMRLAFEVASAPVSLTSFDFVNNKLVFKATVPDTYVGKITEIGLYSGPEESYATDFGSKILTTFDSESETWSNAAWSTNTRVGPDALRLSPAASGSATSILTGFVLDLSENLSSDTIKFAVSVGNANTSAVRFRLMTDPSNYFEYNNNSSAVTSAGYRILEQQKSAFTTLGTPNWGNLTRLETTVVSKSSGASQVDFDAIRIEDKTTVNVNSALVARKVLPTAITKVNGQALDIEFTLDVNV